ncbi:MAG: choice-of-anchor D domain-containing protein [Myxococcales bacterium]|nr:choice-of-anchor D domain-containing protein [Myxococcales bacterium]
MRLGPSLALVVALALVGCRCDRGQNLTGRFGELVVVSGAPGSETLTREAQVSVPSAPMGESSSGSFLVRNIGDGQLTLTRLKLASGSTAFAAELPERTVLEPSDEIVFTVTFSPEQAADVTLATVPHVAVFELESTGGRAGETQATLELNAIAEARDCYVPPLLDFGEAPIGQAVFIPLSLANTSATATQATVSQVSGANPAFFTVDPPGPDLEVPAQSPFEVRVRFSPTSELEAQAQLTVRRRASCPEGVTRLIGRGSMQSLSWAPAEVNFGRVPLDETATRAVTFSNRSGAALPLTVVAEGADFATPMPSAVLPARSTVTVQVSCRPTSLSALTGALRIDVGTSPVLPVRVPLRCSGGGPRLRPTPSPLAFGTVPLLLDRPGGSPLPQTGQTLIIRRLRLENVGTPPLSAGDPTFNLVLGRDGTLPLMSLTPLGSTSATEFKVAITRYTAIGVPAVAGRNTIDLEVQLQPVALGLREALLSVYSNDAVQPVHEIRLTANATVAERCSLAITPAAVSFGEVPPDSLEQQTLTLLNAGTATCAVSGLEIASGSSPAFSLAASVPSSLTLFPGQSRPIQVQFDSTGLSTGTVESGFLRFSTAGATTPKTVPLSARISQCIVMVPEELDFGNIKLGCRSAPRPVQLFNICGTPIRVTQFSAAGQGFSISSMPMIPAGGLVVNGSSSTTASLVFQPPALGTFLGTLTVTTGMVSGGRGVTLPLRGVGDTTGTTVETFVQPAQPQVDILFTIDNSCSMFEEQTALATNFNAFISYATTANVDYRIAVVTTDDFASTGQGKFVTTGGGPAVLERSMPNVQQAFAQRVNVGINGSGNEKPLSTTLKALTAPLTTSTNSGFLRDDANLAIILVTDAPDQSTEPLDYFMNRLPLVKGPRRIHQVSVSAIGPFTAQPAGSMCFIEGVDPGRYDALVTKTGGVKSDICTSNWARDLEALGRSALGPRSSFFVRNPPDTQQPIDVQVNGQSVSNAWNYDPNANAIVFQPAQAPGAGTTLTVTYQSVCL